MRFRKNLFSILALLSVLWIVFGFSVSSRAYSTVTSITPTPVTGSSLSAQDTANLRAAGAGIGAGLGLTFFLCTGGLPFIVFSLLAWRNGVGLTRERMHREEIEALKGKGT